MASSEHRLFRGLFLVNFLISLGFGISDAFFSLYCQSIGASGLLLGIAVSIYALTKIIFSPLMGQLADRVGRRPLVFGSLTLYLLVACGYLTTESLAIVICLRLLQGASCAMFRPVVQALLADSTKVEKRGSVMGSFDVSFYAALSIGPFIGGMIMDYWGFTGLFGILILCSLTSLGLVAVMLPRQIEETGKSGQRTKRSVKALCEQGGTYPGLLLFIFGRACGIAAYATFLPIFLSSELSMSGMQIGTIMAASTLVMSVLLRPAGKIADRMPRKLLVLCGGTAVPLLYLFLSVAVDFTQVLVVALGIGIFSALSQPAATALLTEEGDRYGMGASLGIFHAFLNTGFVAGSFVGGVMLSAIGIQGVFIGMGLIGMISAGGFALSLAHNSLARGQQEPGRGTV
jgi:MFS family permease